MTVNLLDDGNAWPLSRFGPTLHATRCQHTRASFVERLTRSLTVARAQGRNADDLLSEDAASFTTRILATHDLIAVRTAPLA